MSFTYDPEDVTTPLAKVRFLTQDTADPGFLSDEEIAFLVAEEASNVYFTAARACEAIATKFGSIRGKTVGDLTLSGGRDQASQYRTMAAALRLRALRNAVPTPYAAGLHVDDRDANQDDDSLVQHSFRRGMDDTSGLPDRFNTLSDFD